MRIRRSLAALTAVATGMASAVVLVAVAEPAAAAAPIRILNTSNGGSRPAWMETQAIPDDTAGRRVTVTFLVEHVAGRRVTDVHVNNDLRESDQSFGVTPQIYPGPTANGLETSRVTLTFDPGKSPDFACDLNPIGGFDHVRSVTRNLGFRVEDNIGDLSAEVSTSVTQAEDAQCTSADDFTVIQTTTTETIAATPGQNVTFSFTADDADGTGSNDHFDRFDPRWRRVNDGTIVELGEVNPGGDNDNQNINYTVAAPGRGRWVLEASLGTEDGYGQSRGWTRLGGVDVNETTVPTASIGFSATPSSALFNSTPPSVNEDIPVDAVLTTGDTNGAVQVAEWDATNNGSFERTEYTVPTSPNSSHSALTSTERTQSISTTTFGTRNVRVRVTDNGAIDASDDIARQNTVSSSLRVNAIPTANAQTVNTTEDNAIGFTLGGNDADNQPAVLSYAVTSSPPVSAGTLNCSTIPACTFTPAANFNGSTTLEFRVADGPVTSGANAGQAWSSSATATVTINVAAVNDTPTANPQSRTTAEDTALPITLTGTDVEAGALTYTIVSGPTNGTLSPPGGSGAARTYTPNANFHGADSFVFRATDSGGLSGTATVSITVTPVNDAPVAVDQTLNTDEDTALNFSLAASDVDGNVPTFTAPTSGPSSGDVNCVGSACTYTPHENSNGTDSFTFTANDGTGTPNATDSGTITINVDPVNDAPEAEAQSVTLDEDTPTGITLGASDVDFDPLTFSILDGPDSGSTTVPVGNLTTYTPNPQYFGGDQFEFEAFDGELGDTAIVVLTVNPVNDAPTVAPQTFSTDEDTPLIISVAASDIDGDELSWSVPADPTNGQLVGALPDIGYLPNGNFHGTDTFTVAVSDGTATVEQVMTVVVAPINDQPVASASTIEVDEDGSAGFTLGGSDVDGDDLQYTITNGTDHGTLDCTGTAGDACTYTPNADFHGNDQATYEVTDGTLSDSASVTITVRSINDAPVPAAVVAVTDEDTPVGITLSATDVDGDILSYSVGTGPSNGTLDGTPPTLVYTPAADYFGPDAFDFVVSDGTADVGATAVIAVTAVNDAPVALDVSASTDEDMPVGFTVSATDVDSTGLTFTVDSPADGDVDCVAADCTFTPGTNFVGVVTFGFQASDGSASDGGLITIAVGQVNDAPSADDSDVVTDEDTPVGIALIATDVDDDALGYQVTDGPDHGTLDGTAPALVYTPAGDFSGTDSFDWEVADGNGGSATATVTITVDPVNDAPVALPRVVDGDEDTPVSFSLLAEDAEGDPLTFAAGPASSGTVSCTTAGACTYTPAANFAGVASFDFTVTDPSGASSSATVTITVDAAPLIATTLIAEPVLLTLGPVFRARLTAPGGVPVPGRLIRFTAGGSLRCQAVTDANGNAICGPPLLDLLALLNLGYDASFAGDFDYAASTGRGVLIRLLLRLF